MASGSRDEKKDKGKGREVIASGDEPGSNAEVVSPVRNSGDSSFESAYKEVPRTVNTRDQNPFAGPSRQRPNNDAAVNSKALSRSHKGGSMLNNNQLMALFAQLEIEADVEREDSGDYDQDMRDFMRSYPKSTLAIAWNRQGTLPSSYQPGYHDLTWGLVLGRGKLSSDPMEVQEFFFGIQPLERFDWTFFRNLPAELRIAIFVEEAIPGHMFRGLTRRIQGERL
ncbi:hypothetical protein G7Y89_g2927 [Cudoniella acicularis]|uniref:Uncharacterized protein n=1 Tax=Cudoniella acicularis TaxID=354080 RepID=A0A8H4RSD2_9HELO|nr:hypothetical protein G7Y89_g2927 [Cudoniella acicularis]